MSKGKLHKIIINPDAHCLKLRFAQHPSESTKRAVLKFIACYLLSDHELREFSEVCQGGVPDLVSTSDNLCLWLEPPKTKSYIKFQRDFDFQLILVCEGIDGSELETQEWTIEKTGEIDYSLNGKPFKASLIPLD